MKKNSLKQSILFALLLIALTLSVFSCAPESSSRKDALGENPEEITVTLGMKKSRQVFRMSTYLEIDNITLQVSQNGTILSTINLDNSTGTWTGVLGGLDINTTYNFTARAYQTGTKIFEGSANQALNSGNNALHIVMAPTTGTNIVTLPKILRVFRWNPTGAGSSEPVSVVLQSPTGNSLDYSFTVDAGGGTYAISSGTLSISTTITTLTTNYTAPTNSTVMSQHTFKLLDTQEQNSTSTTYTISVDNASCVFGVSLLSLDNATSLCNLQ